MTCRSPKQRVVLNAAGRVALADGTESSKIGGDILRPLFQTAPTRLLCVGSERPRLNARASSSTDVPRGLTTARYAARRS